ncbi:hypothetical protein A1D31_14135 [Bradyrhizobium liaoningense]|nr:hypothetical protein A1D31_14135 [Bradyrhizobium liaoningense]
MTPLNGTKTHPLSAHAINVLRSLARCPDPAQEINPGVGNRLMRESLVEIVNLPSPYKKHRGAVIPHYQITDAGRAAILAAEGKS